MDSPTDISPDFQESSKPEQSYKPVQPHWFHGKVLENKILWRPFSQLDSDKLQTVYSSGSSGEELIPTDGGRYDVNLNKRERLPVYWREDNEIVRRCSWFYKSNIESRYIPFSEDVADILEEEYRLGVITGVWNRKVALPNDESVVLHSHLVMVLFTRQSSPDTWNATPPFFAPPTQRLVYRGMDVLLDTVPLSEDTAEVPDHLLFIVHGIGEPKKHLQKETESAADNCQEGLPRAHPVKRGVDPSQVDQPGEQQQADHLMLLVHGIGAVCDLKFRSLEEVVDDFRAIGRQLIQSHYKTSYEQKAISKIEVLPISWHWNLHSEETGIDRRINEITLESVPKLRGFTNDTLLDILFYTSPKFCQTIISTVGDEMNRIYSLFRKRNPDFKGGVSIGGHSLGSVICFDLLSHQVPPESSDSATALLSKTTRSSISYMSGTAGTGQASVIYPQLVFQPQSFFALGSPIGMFLCVRGHDQVGDDYRLPTCPGFFNIFHPFDPVAYRIESLINPEMTKVPPVQIPHHKGRKRMHLELKDTVFRVGYDIKQKLMESVKSTWDTFTQLAAFTSPRDAAIGERVKEVIVEELNRESAAESEDSQNVDCATPSPEDAPPQGVIGKVGSLNMGRRVDYVLQEAPFEVFNEYIFALASHVCYWESADTMLLILKEIYSSMGYDPDAQVVASSLSVDKPAASKVFSSDKDIAGISSPPQSPTALMKTQNQTDGTS